MKSPRFLFIRFGAIGDCTMAAWAATSIRKKYPDSLIVWPIEERCAPVLDTCELVDEVEIFPRERWKRRRWSPLTWQEQLLKYTRLRRWDFDFGIDLHGHAKSALCLRLAAPRRRVAARATDELSLRLNPVLPPPPIDIHMVDWNHQALSTFGEFELPQRPIMPAVDSGRAGRRATISVGAGEEDKKYPVDSWRQVAMRLLEDDFDVRFVGGKGDAPVLGIGVDLVGKLTLRETMKEVAGSTLHLAADTGTGHIAAAYGVPVVSIFGRTDPAVFRPYTEQGAVLRNGLAPASVSPEEVMAAASRLLGSQRAFLN